MCNIIINTHAHTHTWEDQCEWHRMTRMTGPDCAVMCNLINTHTHIHTHKHWEDQCGPVWTIMCNLIIPGTYTYTHGELLLFFPNNRDLGLVNAFFSTPKGGVSHTFNGRVKTRIDCILKRQLDCKLIRDVTVHPQPFFFPVSDRTIVSAFGQVHRPFCLKPPVKDLS